MIELIQIEGFQAYKDFTELYLHPGLNVIVGDSDTAKSTVIRAIKWVAQNKPRGDDFRNWAMNEKDPVTVSLIDNTNNFIVRHKGKNENFYYVNDEENPLKCVRSDVPTEAMDVLQMDEINIQSQHPNEQYFLLAEKPGVVAKKFNEATGLSIMDKAQKEVNSRIRSANSEYHYKDGDLTNKQSELKALSWLKKAEEEFDVLDELNIDIIKLVGKFNLIDELMVKCFTAEKELKELDFVVSAEIAVDLLKIQFELITAEIEQLKTVDKLVNHAKKLILDIDEYRHIDKAETALKSLEKLDLEITTLKTKKSIITTRVELINGIDFEIEDIDSEIMDLEGLIHDKLDGLPCPVCGREK